MSYEEDIAFGVQQMLDADLQFPQDVPDTNVVKTNADHIRHMTDEELINVVPCPMGFSMFRCTAPMPCGDCKREWLKKPYKEATT